MAIISAIKKGLEIDKKSGKSNFENHIELHPVSLIRVHSVWCDT